MNISFLSIESWESWHHRKMNEPLSSRFQIERVCVKIHRYLPASVQNFAINSFCFLRELFSCWQKTITFPFDQMDSYFIREEIMRNKIVGNCNEIN